MVKRRRANHEGSFFKRSDGRFEGKVFIGYDRGTPKYKSVIRRTQKDAYAAWQELKRQYAAGLDLTAKRQTVAQYLERWLSDVAAHRVRPTTLERYRHASRRMVKHIGHIQLSRLTPQDVQGMLARALRSGYAATTVVADRRILILALDTAEQWGLISRNVAKRTDVPKVEAREVHALTLEEARRLLQATQHDRLAALWRLALGLGLRRGEVLGLRWQDVNLERGMLRITLNLQRIAGRLVLIQPKTTGSRRTLPLPPSLLVALRHHKTQQLHDRLIAGTRWQEHGLVFCTRQGAPISPNTMLYAFGVALKKAGLPPMRFHDLRHSCATILLASGERVKVVQEILGHANPTITLGIYQHVRSEERQEALERLDNRLQFDDDDRREEGT